MENITSAILFCKEIQPQIFICEKITQNQLPKEVFDAPGKLSYI